jgi:hypothetical protein
VDLAVTGAHRYCTRREGAGQDETMDAVMMGLDAVVAPSSAPTRPSFIGDSMTIASQQLS